jgi:hypothetical protein
VDAEQGVGGHAVQLVVLPFELVDEAVPLLHIKERLVGAQREKHKKEESENVSAACVQ